MKVRRTLGLAPVMGLPLLLAIALPVIALSLAANPTELWQALGHPRLAEALALSARTSLLSLILIVAMGTPLAWYLARSRSRWASVVETLIALPVVIPPAVVGVALLHAFGRRGLLGGWLGDALAFTPAAVVTAQVVVASPFFLQAAIAAFRDVDEDLLLVARSLGASARSAIWRVAIPAAAPALIAGATLSWARAVGEFGATLLFAGNLPGQTQTLPLAIYAAMEEDMALARALALLLGALAFAALLAIRWVPGAHDSKRRGQR
ncbi:MAG: molybdate ABC transporter permease subunit [Myxococcales bacterium]|nr:molybdate ABC transporter permease subunit [Myxococcales bacterium]